MAATAHLTIDQGSSFSTDITVKDANGDVFDLTGYTASAKMARGFASTRTRVIFTTAIDSPTTGIVTLSLSADQTNNLDAPARYVYDVELLRSSDSTITRVIEGIIKVTPSVTT